MFHDVFYVQEGSKKISETEQIEEVKRNFPEATISSFTPSYAADRTSEVGINDNGKNISVFVNPYDGEITGTIKDEDRLMTVIKDFHNGELWGGTIGNRIVELSACWTVILVITGLYLWWPRNRKSLFGTFIPRFRLSKDKRMFWRDMHVVPAFWLSVFLVVQILSGLLWTDVWGEKVKDVVTATGTGKPAGIQPWEKYAFPKSTVPTKDVADVPWAAENLPVPESNQSNQTSQISIEEVMTIAKSNGVENGYNIIFPEDEKGVFTVYLDPAEVYTDSLSPQSQKTLHIDQYNGNVLANLGWKDYGVMAKIMAIGIALHQGEYGLINQLLGLVLVVGVILFVFSGVIMWWKRKPSGKLGAPSLPENFRLLKGVGIIVIALGIFFPLVGISLLVVLVLDKLIIKRIPALQNWIT
jgi:uncharacterized iron-regulated membrane protein